MHQVGAGVLGPVFRAQDPQTDRTVALKSFPLDITPEQAAEFAEELRRLASLDLNHPSLIAPRVAGVEGHTAFLVEDYFVAESIDIAIRQYGPAPAADAVRLIGQLAGALDFAAAVGVHHGALHPRDVLVAPREVRMTGIGVAGALERVGFKVAARRPYSAPERAEGAEASLASDLYALAVIAYELLTGRRPASDGETLQPDPGAVAAAEPAALAEVFARAFSLRPEDRYPSALAFAGALKHALTAQPIELAADAPKPAEVAERPRARRPRAGSKISEPRADAAQASPPAARQPESFDTGAVQASSAAGREPEGPPSSPAAREPESVETTARQASPPAGYSARTLETPAESLETPAESLETGGGQASPPAGRQAEASNATEPEPAAQAPESLFAAEPELPAPPPLTLDDLDLRSEESELPLLDKAEEPAVPVGPSFLDEAPSSIEAPPAAVGATPSDVSRPAHPARSVTPDVGPQRGRPRVTPVAGGFERPTPQKRRISGVALLLMLLFGVLLGLGAGYYFAVRDTADTPAPGDAAAPTGQASPSQNPADTAQGQTSATPSQGQPPSAATAPPPSGGAVPQPSSPAAVPPAAAASPGATGPGTAPGRSTPEPNSRAKARGAASGPEGRREAKARTPAPRAKAAASRDVAGTAAGAERTRRGVFEGALAVISKPAGARVFVDGHPVGTTPITLPRLSAGSHVVRLERDGYSTWSGAIQVVAGEQNRVTASLEQRSSK